MYQEFINNNGYNVIFERATHEGNMAALIHKENFENNILFDSVNTDVANYFVYIKEGQPVAWFNIETLQGFIKV